MRRTTSLHGTETVDFFQFSQLTDKVSPSKLTGWVSSSVLPNLSLREHVEPLNNLVITLSLAFYVQTHYSRIFQIFVTADVTSEEKISVV
jgi:hypothetical protein